MGSSQLKLGRTTTMKFLVAVAWQLLEWLLSPDSIEDMLDIMEATVAMVDTITSARGLLTPRPSLDSMEDTMVDSMEDIEDMEAMGITSARGLLMLMLSLDSMEDTMVDSVEDMGMEAMAIMDRFLVVDEQEFL